MGPLIGGALITAGAGLLSNILGASASSSAGKAQLQATRETNQTNIALAQQQRDWSERMVAQQNQYNSLAEQRKRAEDAGYSPYILSGQNSALQSEVPQYDRANVQTPDYGLQQNAAQMLSNIPSSLIGTLAQAVNAEKAHQETEFTGAQTRAQEIENSYRVSKILADLDAKRADTRDKNAKAFIDEIQGDIFRSQSSDLKKRAALENERIASQASEHFAQEMYARSLVAAKAKELLWLDKEKRASLAHTAASTAALCAQRNLSLAQARVAVRNAVLLDIQAAGQRIDNRIKSVADGYAEQLTQEQLNLMRSRGRNIDAHSDYMPTEYLIKAASAASPYTH